MNPRVRGWTLLTLGLLLAGLCACVAGGYGYGGGVGYDAGFYEPYGYEYGGWGPGYFVGPARDGGRGHGAPRSGGYRGAPAGRATPSIPSGARGGGGARGR
jgi:hypothetical protein